VVRRFKQGEVCALKNEDLGLVEQIFPGLSEDCSALEMPGTTVAQ
jgi:hypothetical protein